MIKIIKILFFFFLAWISQSFADIWNFQTIDNEFNVDITASSWSGSTIATAHQFNFVYCATWDWIFKALMYGRQTANTSTDVGHFVLFSLCWGINQIDEFAEGLGSNSWPMVHFHVESANANRPATDQVHVFYWADATTGNFLVFSTYEGINNASLNFQTSTITSTGALVYTLVDGQNLNVRSSLVTSPPPYTGSIANGVCPVSTIVGNSVISDIVNFTIPFTSVQPLSFASCPLFVFYHFLTLPNDSSGMTVIHPCYGWSTNTCYNGLIGGTVLVNGFTGGIRVWDIIVLIAFMWLVLSAIWVFSMTGRKNYLSRDKNFKK